MLLRDGDLMEKAALADLRGYADPVLSQELRSVQVAEDWYQALLRVQARLMSRARNRRATRGPDRVFHAVHADAEHVTAQVSLAHRVVKAHHSARTVRDERPYPEQWASGLVRKAHSDEYHQRLEELLSLHGLPLHRRYSIPGPDRVWDDAVARGMVTPHPDELRMRELAAADFDVLVRADVRSHARGDAARPGDRFAPELRLPGVLDRWARHLVALQEEVNAQPEPADQLAAARRSAFKQTILARRGEVGRLVAARQKDLAALYEALDRLEVRTQCARAALDDLLAAHGAEFDGLVQVAPPDNGTWLRHLRAARQAGLNEHTAWFAGHPIHSS